MTEILYHRFYAHLVPLTRAAARAVNCVFSPTATVPSQPRQPSFGNCDLYSIFLLLDTKNAFMSSECETVCVYIGVRLLYSATRKATIGRNLKISCRTHCLISWRVQNTILPSAVVFVFLQTVYEAYVAPTEIPLSHSDKILYFVERASRYNSC